VKSGIQQDRVAIVTGAAKGIGQAIAEEVAKEGAKVVVVDVDPKGAKATATQLRSVALAVEADVADEHAVASMVERTVREFGGINILVNNAGLYPRYAWHQMTVEEWDRTQAVNLKGCFLCARAVFPHLKANGSGKIINLSSVTFWVGAPRNLVHYIASKGGVIGFTRALARDVGEFNIQVNAITPGAVETEEERKVATPEQVAEIVARQSLRRRITPKDIARTAVFLASSDSDAVTGQTINVDGGWAMH
jgi:3-oxoacyl-[acyl-carrier protein] reductase